MRYLLHGRLLSSDSGYGGRWIGLTLMIAVLLYICNQIRQEWSLFREYLRDYALSTLYNLSYCCLITCVPAIVYYKAGGVPGFSTPTPGVLLGLFHISNAVLHNQLDTDQHKDSPV